MVDRKHSQVASEPIDRRGVLGLSIIAIIVMAGAFFLYSWDCDAAFAVNDALFYGKTAEDRPWESLQGHHPLFHVLLSAAAPPLRAIGVAHPGHMAARLVAGLGTVAIVVLLCAIAGRNRLRAGLLCAMPFLLTRGVVLETATGETVLPACAAALWALWAASRPQTSVWRATLWLVVALGLRQDNILFVPGFAVAMAARLPKGNRLATVAKTMVVAAGGTIAIYAACWWVGGGEATFIEWLLELAQRDGRAWAPASGPDTRWLLPYVGASGAAVIGMQWDPFASWSGWAHAAVGVSFILLLLGAAGLQRGDRRMTPFIIAAMVTGVCRFPFYWWFEPLNFEWWIGTLTLVAAAAAAICSGTPVTNRKVRKIGVVMLLALPVVTAVAHAPTTWALRSRSLAEARDAAIALGGPPSTCRYLSYGLRPAAAFYMVNMRHSSNVLTAHQHPKLRSQIRQALRERPVRTVVLIDRWVSNGMPWTLRRRTDELSDLLDGAESDSNTLKVIRDRGRVVVLGFNLDG